MSTHNICFRREIRKILCGYPLLSVAVHCIIESLHFSSSGYDFIMSQGCKTTNHNECPEHYGWWGNQKSLIF